MDISAAKAALQADPTNLDVMEKLHTAGVDSGDLDLLQELHERIFEVIVPGPQAEALMRAIDLKARTTKNEAVAAYLYARLGLLYWRKLDSGDRAELYFRRVDANDPEFAEVYEEFYTDFYAKRGNWRRLEQFLVEKAGSPEAPAAVAELKRKLARLAADFNSPDKAVGFWANVLEIDPSDTEAEEALLTLYTQVKKWHSLVELYQKRLDRLPGSAKAEKIELFLQMIRVYRDEIRSETKVNATYQAILELDPGNRMALDALEAQFDAMKRWPDLVRVLQQKIEHSTDRAELIGLHQRVASIMLDRFSNSAEALKSYHAILELEPDNRDAIAKLLDIYEKRRDYESYLEVARREVDLEPSDQARKDKFLALARFAGANIRKPSAAIALWEEVLALASDNVEALEALEQLYEREKDYEKLALTIERRAASAQDPAAKVSLLDKLGLVLSTRLQDNDRAVDIYRRILEVQPDHRKAQNELRKHYLATRDWSSLEWFFRQYANVAELVRTLEAQVKAVESNDERIALLFRAAELSQTDLEQPDRAARFYEKVFEVDPVNATAAQRLAPLYRKESAWSKLGQVLEIQLQTETSPQGRSSLLLELARLYEERLGDADKAFFSFVQAYKEDSSDASARGELERLAEKSGNWDTYAAVLEETLPRMTDARARSTAEIRAAEIYRDHIGDKRQALRHFQMAIALDATNVVAMDAIEDLYTAGGDWRLLVELYKRKRELARNEGDEKSILFKLGAVWRDRLNNANEAAAVFQDALDRFPNDTRAHRELAAIYLEQQDFAALLDVLTRELEVSERDFDAQPTHVAELHVQLAQLIYATEGDVHDVVHHYRSALGNDSENAAAVQGLEELIGEPAVQREISETLEPIYRLRQDWEKLSDVYEIQLRDEVPGGHALALLRMLGEIYRDRLQDDTRAFRSFARMFDRSPTELDVREPLEALAARIGGFELLVELYEGKVEDLYEEPLRSDVRFTIARTYEAELGDLRNARKHYEALLESSPDHTQALDALERIYAKTEAWTELLGVYRRKLELSTDSEARIGLLSRIEQIWAEQLRDTDEAISAANEILVIDPNRVYAWRRLEDLYARAARWDDLAMALQERIRLAADKPERLELLNRLADVWEFRLDDVGSAIEVRGRALEVDADHAETLAALERLFDARTQASVVASMLSPYYERTGNWNRLVEVYEVEKEGSDDPRARVEIDFRIAALYEDKLSDAESAFLYFGQAYAAMPEREQAVSNILRLADIIGNHVEATKLLEVYVSEIGDPERRRETHRTIARTAESKAKDSATAVTHYEAVLELDPGDVTALDALLALHRKTDSWAAQVDVLQRKAEISADVALRVDLLKEAAEISAVALEKPKDAIALYEQVAGLAPADAEVLDALETLHERVGDWESLVAVLSRKIELASDLEARKVLALRRAEVLDAKLEALDDAAFALRQVLEWDANDLTALRRLDSLFVRKGDWFDVLQNLQRMQPLLGAAEQIDVQLRIGAVWETELESTVQAIAAYGGVLEREPSEERALAALEAIVHDKDERSEAFATLAPVLELLDQWSRLFGLTEVMVQHGDDPTEQAKLLHRMAGIAEQKMGEPAQAFDCWARAFRLQSEDTDAVMELERLASEHGLWEQLQALYREGAKASSDPSQSKRYLLRVGEILRDNLASAPRATAVYEGLLEDYPDDLGVLEPLDGLYSKQGSWPQLASVLRARIDVQPEPADKIALTFRLGDLNLDKLDKPNEAFDSYREVLYLDPGNDRAVGQLRLLCDTGIRRIEATELLEPVYRDRGAWKDLAALFAVRLEESADPLDRAELLRNLADISLNRLDDPTAAMGWYGQAFALDPEDELVYGQMDELAQLTGEYGPFVDYILGGATASDNPDRQVELWHRAAKMCRQNLDAAEKAEYLYLEVLGVAGDDQAALLGLDEIYSAAARFADLEGVLRKRIATADYEDQQVALLGRVAAIYRDKLGRSDDAVASYRKILDLDGSNEAALRALVDLYAARGEYKAQFDAQRELQAIVQSDEERLSLLEGLARLAEDRLQDVVEATGLWEEVLVLRPDRRSALLELERLLEARGQLEALATAMERELTLLSDADGSRKLELHRRLGRLCRDTLDDALGAQSHWEAVLAAEPEDQEALRSLRTLYRDGAAVEPLADVCERLVLLVPNDDPELRGLWVELAELRQDMLGQPEGAIEAWEAASALDPEDDRALDQLERLYSEQGNWASTAATLQKKLAWLRRHGEESAAVDLAMRIASIQQDKLSDRAQAAQTLQELLAAHPDNLDASMLLERNYELGEQWSDLAELLMGRLDLAVDGVDRAATLHKLAALHEARLGQPEASLLFLLKALEDDAEDRHALAEVDRIAAVTGQWSDAIGTLEDAVARMQDPLLRADTLYRLGCICRDQLDDAERAVSHFEAGLALQPEHEPTLVALTELHTALEEWPKLIAILGALADVASDYRERVRAAVRIGDVYARQLRKPAEAIDAYRRVLDLDELEVTALDALDDLYTQKGAWKELVDILDLKARAQPELETAIRLRTGGVYASKLSDSDAAIEAYEGVLARDPANGEALGALQDLYGAKDDWDGLVAVFERLLLSTEDVGERKALYQKIALVREEMFGDPLSAADAHREILGIDPMDREALLNLERIFEAQKVWDDLVSTMERHAEVVQGAERVQVLIRMAEVYRQHMGDIDNAIRTYERVLDLEPNREDALSALEALYSENADWARVLEILDKKIDRARGEARTRLRCQKAELYAERLLSIEEATAELDRAVDESPDSLLPIQALQKVYAATDNWEKVIDALLREEDLHQDPELKAATLVRVGEIYRDHLVDQDAAASNFERALEYVPLFAPAALPLSELYIKAEKWAKADPLLRMLVTSVETEEDPKKAGDLYYLIGRSKQNLLEDDEALLYFEAAVEKMPDHAPSLRGLAELSFKKQRMQDAERYYVALVERIRDTASTEELVQCYKALGEIALALNEDSRAYGYLDRVLELQPNNIEAITSLIELARDQNNWSQMVKYQRELIGLKSDPLDKLALQLEIADAYRDKIRSTKDAVQAYRDALELQPRSKVALVKLLELEVTANNHRDAVDILKRLVGVEEETAGKANYAFMLAVIFRDELKDEDQALQYLDETLSHDPLKLEAFAMADEIFTRRKDWEAERRAYLKQIERLEGKGQGALEFKLYKALGEIYRTRLKNYEYAISAFELAASRKPEDPSTFEILAELYEVAAGDRRKAISAHRRLIELEPERRIGSYRTLYRLFREAGSEDGAWCVAGLLVGLGQADPEMTSFYENYRETGAAQVDRPLDAKLWGACVLANSDDVGIGEVFQILYETLGGELRAKTLKDLDLKKKDQVELNDGTLFSNTMLQAVKALGVIEPKVYVSERLLGLRIENLNPPVLLVGKDMFKGRTEKELAFLLGKALTYFLPIHVMAGMYSQADLKTLFVAAMKVAVPDFPLRDDEQVREIATELERRITAAQRQRLADRLNQLREGQVNLASWMNNIELSANHAGALLANDFEVAMKALRTEAFALSKLPPKDKAKDLVLYTISDRYLRLRRELGLAIAETGVPVSSPQTA